MKRYILTGTPGSGKTAIIRALETQKYSVIEEAATDVIALEQAQGHKAPWNQPGFIDKIVQLQQYRQLQGACDASGVQFHDRSPFCTYALAQYLGIEPSAALLQEIRRIEADKIFEKRVFFIENLGFLSPTDARTISYEESLIFEKTHADTYLQFGYQLIRIGKGSLSQRTQQVTKEMQVE